MLQFSLRLAREGGRENSNLEREREREREREDKIILYYTGIKI